MILEGLSKVKFRFIRIRARISRSLWGLSLSRYPCIHP